LTPVISFKPTTVDGCNVDFIANADLGFIAPQAITKYGYFIQSSLLVLPERHFVNWHNMTTKNI
jgi:hypothetical protein